MLQKLYARVMQDSLYRNAFYLLASTGVNAALGFFFWIIAAHLYSQSDLGIASVLIAMMGLVTSFSLLGFTIGLVRFLPTARDPNKHINTAFTVTLIAAFVASIIFIVGIPLFSPALLFIRKEPWAMVFFTVSMMALTLFNVVDAVYTAKRANQYVLLKNTIFSVFKLVLPPLLVAYGAFGLFGSWTLAGALSTLVVFILLVRRFKYVPSVRVCKETLKAILPYNLGNYTEGFISSIPLFVMPVLIVNHLGPEIAAEYAIVMTFIMLLYVIPQAIAQSLFAEGSHDERSLAANVRKARIGGAFIVIPAVLVLLIFGKFILSLFGSSYAAGFSFMQLMTISAVFLAYNSVYSMQMRIQNRIKGLIAISTCFTVIVLFIANKLIVTEGLTGVAAAWIIGYAAVSVVYTIIYRDRLPQSKA